MRPDHEPPAGPARLNRLQIIMILGGAVAGGVSVGGLERLAGLGKGSRTALSDEAALVIALGLAGAGLMTLLLLGLRGGRALLADPEAPGRPPSRDQTWTFFLQAIVLILAGGLLAAAPLGLAAGAANPPARPWIMAGLAGALLAQGALNLLLFRRSDEVQQKAISDSAAVTFWTSLGLLLLWASGEKLGALPALSSWDALTAMMALYLGVSCWIFTRKGLA